MEMSKSNTSAPPENTNHSLDDYLTLLEAEYPGFPVKKTFDQYLQCQKQVITKSKWG